MLGPIRTALGRRRPVLAETDDVRDDIAALGRLAARDHPQRDLDVRERLGVRIGRGLLAEALVEDEVGQGDVAGADALADGAQVLVDALDDAIDRLAAEDLLEHVAAAGQ